MFISLAAARSAPCCLKPELVLARGLMLVLLVANSAQAAPPKRSLPPRPATTMALDNWFSLDDVAHKSQFNDLLPAPKSVPGPAGSEDITVFGHRHSSLDDAWRNDIRAAEPTYEPWADAAQPINKQPAAPTLFDFKF